MKRRFTLIPFRFTQSLALFALLIVAGGCGNDDDDDARDCEAGFRWEGESCVPDPSDDDDDGPIECTQGQIEWGGACVPQPEFPGRVWTDGRRVRDPQGREILLRGLNLSTERKRGDYQGWHTREDYLKMGEEGWGFTNVRHLIGWAAIMPQPGEIDEAYLLELDKRIDWAEESGVYITLDMHQDVFGEGFGGNGAPRWACDESRYDAHEPRSPWYLNYGSPPVIACYRDFYEDLALQAHFAEAWRVVAQRYADRESVIGFDLLNEPFFADYSLDTFHRDVLMPFYGRVVEAIRGEAPLGIVFFEPSTAANLGLGIDFGEVPFPNSIYAPHYYQMDVHDGQPYNGDAEAVATNIDRLNTEAEAMGVPLWVGEFGGQIQAEGFDDYLNDLLNALDDAKAGWTFWDYNRSDAETGFSVVHSDGTEIQHVLDGLVRPYPRATAGELIETSFDRESGTFRMIFLPQPGVTAPTELWVPTRHYPNGYALEVTFDPNDVDASYTEASGGQIVWVSVFDAVGEVEIRVKAK